MSLYSIHICCGLCSRVIWMSTLLIKEEISEFKEAFAVMDNRKINYKVYDLFMQNYVDISSITD